MTGKLLAGWLASLPVDTPTDLRVIDAARNRNHQHVRALLEQKVDANTTQPDGATALHWAAYRDVLETADVLIRAGANVNATNELGVPRCI